MYIRMGVESFLHRFLAGDTMLLTLELPSEIEHMSNCEVEEEDE